MTNQQFEVMMKRLSTISVQLVILIVLLVILIIETGDPV